MFSMAVTVGSALLLLGLWIMVMMSASWQIGAVAVVVTTLAGILAMRSARRENERRRTGS